MVARMFSKTGHVFQQKNRRKTSVEMNNWLEQVKWPITSHICEIIHIEIPTNLSYMISTLLSSCTVLTNILRTLYIIHNGTCPNNHSAKTKSNNNTVSLKIITLDKPFKTEQQILLICIPSVQLRLTRTQLFLIQYFASLKKQVIVSWISFTPGVYINTNIKRF